jgi:DUF971 family protein
MSGNPFPVQPPQSLKGSAEALVIEWRDGVTHSIPWRMLRRRCPCATCRTKREEPPAASSNLFPVLTLQEAQPLKAVGMRPVGNYAYAIEFNDGHNSGIYSLEFLRQLGDECCSDRSH